jgi:rhodanese-related sulfurtransferase
MTELSNIDVAAAQHLLSEGAFLLDVREENEFAAGHAPDAHHTPLSSVPDVLEDLPRDRVIVCVCRSGARSARAANFLLEQGFDAVNLEGGMHAWHDAGAPLLSPDGEPRVA